MRYRPWMLPYIRLKINLEPRMIWLRLQTYWFRSKTCYYLAKGWYLRRKWEKLIRANRS